MAPKAVSRRNAAGRRQDGDSLEETELAAEEEEGDDYDTDQSRPSSGAHETDDRQVRTLGGS